MRFTYIGEKNNTETSTNYYITILSTNFLNTNRMRGWRKLEPKNTI